MFRPSSDAKQLEFYEDRGPKSSKTGIQNLKNKNLPEDVHWESISNCYLSVDNGVDKHKNDLAANEHPLDAFSTDTSRPNFANVDGLEQVMAGHHIKGSPNIDDARNISVKQEVCFP